MRRLITNDGVILFPEFNEVLEDEGLENGDIVIVEVPSLDFEKKKLIEDKGFYFHDRILNVEVGTKIKNPYRIESPFFTLEVSEKFDDIVKNLSHQVFTNDRRFHFEKIPNQRKANNVIDAFIDNCRYEGCKIVKCMHEQELMGFIILKNNGNKIASNLLGAVRPDCHGKMAVPVLYGGTLRLLANEGYVKEYGTISATNVPSINLHFQLGGRLVGTTDKYIRRPSDER